MSGGVMSYTVIDAGARELLERLTQSIKDGSTATFKAKSSFDSAPNPAVLTFNVRLQTLHADTGTHIVDVIDQNGNWIQLVLHDDKYGPITFEITTPTT